MRAARPTLSGSRAVARSVVELHVRMRAATVDDFIERYYACLEEDRLFIHTRQTQPPGTRVRFTLHLQSGEPLLRGRGVVQRLGDDGARPGMEIAFVPVDGDGLRLVERLRERQVAHASRPSADESPALPELVPESNIVPVNPLGGISDGAIDDFIQGSLAKVSSP